MKKLFLLCALHLAPEKLHLAVLSDKAFAIGPYLGSHREIIERMPQGKILFAGEIKTKNHFIVEANETSGLLFKNGVPSDVYYLFSQRVIPVYEGARLYRFKKKRKHLFPMPEKGIDSDNFRHDLRNKLVPIQYAVDSGDKKYPVDFSIFPILEGLIAAYFDERTNEGIHSHAAFEIPNESWARDRIESLRLWLKGERDAIESSEVLRVLAFLSQEPRSEIKVYETR